MKRYTPVITGAAFTSGFATMIHQEGGAWVRYEDHVEAMKRIAGDGVQQEPVSQIGPADIEVVIDKDNLPIWCAAVPNACHDHIKDALDRGISEAKHWVVRSFVRHRGYAAPAPSASPARIETLRKALFESRDAMRVMANWVKKSDPAGHSWGVRMVDRANAALNGEPPASPAALTDDLREALLAEICEHTDSSRTWAEGIVNNAVRKTRLLAAPPTNEAGRLRAALWAIANTYDDHELRQKAQEAYDESI